MTKQKRKKRMRLVQALLSLALILMTGGYFVLTAGSAGAGQSAAAPSETPAPVSPVPSGDHITQKTEVFQKVVPYETVTYQDPTLDAGETVVETKGVKGIHQITKTLTYVGGVLTDTEITAQEVLQPPVTEILLVGCRETLSEQETALEIYTEPEPEPSPVVTAKADTSTNSVSAGTGQAAAQTQAAVTPSPTPAPTPTPTPTPAKTVTTSGGQVLSYSKTISVTATAYTGGGTTATGTAARYGAIAVDPSVIPYGTKMYIVSDDGKWVYGIATAEDCGGAIQGNIIDLYFDTYEECIQFGRRSCTVYILE